MKKYYEKKKKNREKMKMMQNLKINRFSEQGEGRLLGRNVGEVLESGEEGIVPLRLDFPISKLLEASGIRGGWNLYFPLRRASH